MSTPTRAFSKTSFSGIAAHQRDDLFADAICGEVPSEPTFRQRLGVIAAIPGVRDVVDDLNLDLLRRAKDLGTVRTPGGTYMPLDMDVSVLVNDDCRKERVGFTYHKVNGYAPIFATPQRTAPGRTAFAERLHPVLPEGRRHGLAAHPGEAARPP